MKKSMCKSSEDLLSESMEPQSLNTELDVFTLLEENITLKEKRDDLIAKNNFSECHDFWIYIYLYDCWIQFWISIWGENTVLQKNVQLERENGRVGKQLDDLKVQQKQLKDQLESLMDKFQKEIEDSQTIHNIQEQQKKTIKELVLNNETNSDSVLKYFVLLTDWWWKCVNRRKSTVNFWGQANEQNID